MISKSTFVTEVYRICFKEQTPITRNSLGIVSVDYDLKRFGLSLLFHVEKYIC